MPRNNAGPSTLRNRNRVTNKTRLKIIRGNVDADSFILDEDEEKARVVSTAGVDAEDANEHHLQAVLSAAATRQQSISHSTRGASEKESAARVAYIPTPDSTGVVDNYELLYTSGRWKDPFSYVKSTDTVEEATSFALANGFIYYMDERDKEWLDKNNEEARGEGTSAQGAVSSGGTRSVRSTKSKGKDPETSQTVVMTEDEFELVMALFEKITHEKTEFLHHGLEQGSPFPPFSDYHDTFANPLTSNMFALYSVPSWIPSPVELLRYAKVVYFHWKERRLERSGHPIIPFVNLDETDTKNESYICFRRREMKAVRKTRAQQATYSDKMLRLQNELATATELAKGAYHREKLKKDFVNQSRTVWEARFNLVDLKRKFPQLSIAADDDLLQDKEKAPKKAKTESSGRIPLKLRAGSNGDGSPMSQDPIPHPRDRQAAIQKYVDQQLETRKERDRHWEDMLDNPYQPTPTPYGSRLFKTIASLRSMPSNPAEHEGEETLTHHRSARLRCGRGGRRYIDRRSFSPRMMPSNSEESAIDDVDAQERVRRMTERWKYDEDDAPAVSPRGADEQDRVLFDDYDPRHLSYRMTLLSDRDQHIFNTDFTLFRTLPDGRVERYLPFKAGLPPTPGRDVMHAQRAGPPGSHPSATIPSLRHPSGSSLTIPLSGNPVIAGHSQMKSVATPVPLPMRIPAPPIPSTASNASSHLANTSPNPNATLSGMQDGSKGIAVNGERDVKPIVHPIPRGSPQQHSSPSIVLPQVDAHISPPASTSPGRPKPQNQAQLPSIPSISHSSHGYQLPTAINGYASHMSTTSPYVAPSVRAQGYTAQQLQALKAGFPMTASTQDALLQVHAAQLQRSATSPVPHSANFSAQLAAVRQMQWNTSNVQRPSSVNMDATNMSSSIVGAQGSAMQNIPNWVPSPNGNRRISLNQGMTSPALGHAVSPRQGRASPTTAHMRMTPHSPASHLLGPSLAVAQGQPQGTLSRQSQPSMSSPSLQSQQILGSSGVGY